MLWTVGYRAISLFNGPERGVHGTNAHVWTRISSDFVVWHYRRLAASSVVSHQLGRKLTNSDDVSFVDIDVCTSYGRGGTLARGTAQ